MVLYNMLMIRYNCLCIGLSVFGMLYLSMVSYNCLCCDYSVCVV